ncbi:MAG: Wzz/FepE/Etk N-terminal domain-containing protein, partial [Actinomycetota bacterium]|nr:Wzz/FepE/Etk N-terminal domain-containing protein [Actinomycetota bacterium]
WWVVLAVLALAIGGAVAYVKLKQPVYASSMKIVVGQGPAVLGPNATQSAQPLTQTMTELLESDVVARRVISDMNLNLQPSQLIDRVSVTTRPDTSVLDVQYQDTNRARATRVLGHLGLVFVQLVDKQLSRPSPTTTGTTATNPTPPGPERVTATIFDPAHQLPGKVSPRPVLTVAIATILGLGLGILAAFMRDALMNRIASEEEARDAFRAPVIGMLPRGAVGTSPADVALLPPELSARMAEMFQLLSARIRFSADGGDTGVLLVTSAKPEEGKTTLVSQLAHTIAAAGRSVVAVEGDLRRPALARFFQLPPDQLGITDIMTGDLHPAEALIEPPSERAAMAAERASVGSSGLASLTAEGIGPDDGGHGRLFVLPAGRKRLNPTEALSLTKSADLIAELRQLADYVVIDTPPLLLSGDAFPLAQLADAVVIACREGSTSREEARSVHDTLASLSVPMFGVVLTESSAADRRGYGYAYAE